MTVNNYNFNKIINITYIIWSLVKLTLDKHCYLNTVKEGKTAFYILDQKRAEAVRILQERCGFPSDKDSVHTLECNSIKGMDFSR